MFEEYSNLKKRIELNLTFFIAIHAISLAYGEWNKLYNLTWRSTKLSRFQSNWRIWRQSYRIIAAVLRFECRHCWCVRVCIFMNPILIYNQLQAVRITHSSTKYRMIFWCIGFVNMHVSMCVYSIYLCVRVCQVCLAGAIVIYFVSSSICISKTKWAIWIKYVRCTIKTTLQANE